MSFTFTFQVIVVPEMTGGSNPSQGRGSGWRMNASIHSSVGLRLNAQVPVTVPSTESDHAS